MPQERIPKNIMQKMMGSRKNKIKNMHKIYGNQTKYIKITNQNILSLLSNCRNCTKSLKFNWKAYLRKRKYK